MAVHPKLMIGAGIAIAGLGLIGAGAGATFTAQVSTSTNISTGGVSLTLNGETGSDLDIGLQGENLDSHFAPISRDLLLKNTGSLDLASTFLDVTATGCEGGEGAPLVEHLKVTLMEVTRDAVTDGASEVKIYDGTLCSLVRIVNEDNGDVQSQQGFISPRDHAAVGAQLPNPLGSGESIRYRIVIQPKDAQLGLPTEAQSSSTSVNLTFSGFDY